MVRCFKCDSEAVMPKSGVCLVCGFVNTSVNSLQEKNSSIATISDHLDSGEAEYLDFKEKTNDSDDEIDGENASESDPKESLSNKPLLLEDGDENEPQDEVDIALNFADEANMDEYQKKAIDNVVGSKYEHGTDEVNLYSLVHANDGGLDNKEGADNADLDLGEIDFPLNVTKRARLDSSYRKIVDSCGPVLEKLKGELVAGEGIERRSFMVTSANSGEGVTVASLVAGIAFSRFGSSKVLLVDANAVNPKLHDLFSIKNCPGFVDYILADTKNLNIPNGNSVSSIFKAMNSPEDKGKLPWARCAYYTEYTGLYVMPFAKDAACSLWDLVEHKDFSSRLKVLMQIFDYIIFDSSSVMGTSEATLLSQYVDGVVMVVAAEKTKWEVFDIAVNSIKQAGGVLVGSILNRRKFYIPKFLYDLL